MSPCKGRCCEKNPSAWTHHPRALAPERTCVVGVSERGYDRIDTLVLDREAFGVQNETAVAVPAAGDSWAAIAQNLPAVLSVEVQTLA